MTTNVEPDCWTSMREGPGNFADVTVIGFNAYSGPNTMEIYNEAGGNTVIAYSPLFSDLPVGDKRVVFYARTGFGVDELIIGTSDNNGNSLNYNSIDTIQLTNTYQRFIVELTAANGYNGTDQFVGLRHGQNALFSTIYVDDFDYEVIPTCDIAANLAVSNITANSAMLSWTSGNGNVNGNYEVDYGAGITAPGTGTSVIVNNADSAVISSLTDATGYCAYVREICGSGDTSFWIGPICFQTLCLAQQLPFSENFSFGLGCMTPINHGSTPVGWEDQPAGGSNQFGDLDGTEYAIADSDEHANGIHMICDMETPDIDASTIATGNILALEFDQYYNNIGGDSAIVQVFDGTNWVTVLSQNSDIGGFGNPDHQFIDITAYANANLRVRFHYDDANVWAWYWAVDNILVSEQIPNCNAPTAITSGQVDCDQIELFWTSNSGGSIIEYGPVGFTPGTGAGMFTGIVTSPYTVPGLSATTSYDFYLADTCGNDTSGYSSVFSETTIACPPGCTDPTGLDTANASCTSVDLIWTSGPNTIASAIEWGPSGFLPGGGGTIVAPATSPTNITVSPGTSYDFYVVDLCTTDTSNVVGPFTFITPNGPITAAFTPALGAATATDLTATFDGSASVGATTYTWDFGDGNTGTGANAQNIYTANGTYDVKLIVSGPCGTDSITQQVIIAGISLAENRLGRSLEMYPNPAKESLNITFVTEGSDDARISIIDLTGKTILKVEESNLNGKYDGRIDISTLAKGTYLLKVESGDLSVQRRIIKQ